MWGLSEKIRDIPESFTAKKCTAITSPFGFDKHSSLASYAPKKNKSLLLLSTMHDDNAVDKKVENQK